MSSKFFTFKPPSNKILAVPLETEVLIGMHYCTWTLEAVPTRFDQHR